MFKGGAIGAVPLIHAGQPCGIKQMPNITRGNRADIGGRVGHAERRCANLGDLAAKRISQNGQRVDVRCLALIGRHSHGGIAFQMLH